MSETRKQAVRIVSVDQSARNAKVYDAHTGENLSGFIDRVEITLDANDGITRASVRYLFPIVDVTAEADIESVPLDMNDIDAIDRAIELLEARRTELTSR